MIASTQQVSAIPHSINLLTDPFDNIHGFAAAVTDAYARTLCKYDANGLLFVHANEQEWRDAPGNVVAGVIAARPVFDLPADPPLNAAAAIVAQINGQRTRCQDIAEAVEGLRQRTLASIGKTNIKLMSDPVHGMRNFTDRQIVDRMILKYGTITAATIARYKAFLVTTILPTQDFDVFAAEHREMHARLARGNQGISEFDKCLFLERATSVRNDVSEAIRNFKVEHPRVDQHVFDAMVEHVIEQAPNFAPTTSGAGYAGAMITPSTVQQLIDDALAKAFAAAASGPTAHGKHPQAHRKPPLGTGYRHYCFFHGYSNSHAGAGCKVMINAPAGKYSAAQIAATSHTSVVNGSTAQA